MGWTKYYPPTFVLYIGGEKVTIDLLRCIYGIPIISKEKYVYLHDKNIFFISALKISL